MQIPEWIDYWPAIRRRPFWSTMLSLAIGGFGTGAMLLALLYATVGTADKLLANDPEAGFGSRLTSMHGTAWLALMGASGCMGLAFYAARRIWSAERDSDPVERLRAIRLDVIDLDGYSVFARYGPLLNVDIVGHDWITKTYNHLLLQRLKEVSFGFFHAVPRAIPKSMTMEDDARNRERVREVLDVLRQHELVRSDTPTTVSPEHRKYVLTKLGEIELDRARRRYPSTRSGPPDRANRAN